MSMTNNHWKYYILFENIYRVIQTIHIEKQSGRVITNKNTSYNIYIKTI